MNKAPAAVVKIVMLMLVSVMPALSDADDGNSKASEFSAASVDPASVEESLEPSIDIQQFDNRKVEEYSINGHVYMVRITSAAGSTYSLVDPDGSGEMEWRRDTLGLEVNPPQWTLFRW